MVFLLTHFLKSLSVIFMRYLKVNFYKKVFLFSEYECFACLCTVCVQFPQRPEEEIGFPGTGVVSH